jgi:hypothetical protein
LSYPASILTPMLRHLMLVRLLAPLMLFAPDSGGGGGAGDGGAGGDDKGSGDSRSGSADDKGGDGGAGGDDKSKGETVTMAQADFDALIDKRIGQARKTWEKDATDKADREKLDETERLKAEKADADKAAVEAVAKANAKLVVADAKVAAMAAGVPADRITAFVKLADLSDVEVDDEGAVDAKALDRAVKKTLADNEFLKASTSSPRKGASGGDMNGNGGTSKPKSLEDAVKARLAG